MTNSELHKRFSKPELMEILADLKVISKAAATMTSKDLVTAITAYLDKHGLPDDCSDLSFDFLIAAGFVDENGNTLDHVPEKEEQEPTIRLPQCYGFEDTPSDPACKGCKVRVACRTARESNRPPCFGKLFDNNAAECQVCIEKSFCMLKGGQSA